MPGLLRTGARRAQLWWALRQTPPGAHTRVHTHPCPSGSQETGRSERVNTQAPFSPNSLALASEALTGWADRATAPTKTLAGYFGDE